MIVRMSKVAKGFQVDERDAAEFARFKSHFSEGDKVVAHFRKASDSASEAAMRLFHSLRDAYMVEVGYDKEYAKNELMIRFGVADKIDFDVDEDDKLPPYSGHVVVMYGNVYIRKSIVDYTKDEMHNLIEGTIVACHDNGANIGELVAAYRKDDYGTK